MQLRFQISVIHITKPGYTSFWSSFCVVREQCIQQDITQQYLNYIAHVMGGALLVLAGREQQVKYAYGGYWWSEKEDEKPAAECTSLSGRTGRCWKVFNIVLINAARAYTCTSRDGKELCLYRWTALCLRDKREKPDQKSEIASTTIPALTLNIRLNVQVWPCSQLDWSKKTALISCSRLF